MQAQKPKYWQHTAISPAYPPHPLVQYCMEHCKMREMRFCSTDDLPVPQLVKTMANPAEEWKGQVQIFFSLQDCARTDDWWEALFTNMGMIIVSPVERSRQNRGKLWANYAAKWVTRAVELKENLMIFNIAQARLPKPVQADAQPSQAVQEPPGADKQAPVQPELPPPISAPAEAAPRDDPKFFLVTLSDEERKEYVASQCEAEDDRLFAGQPKQVKRKRNLKSKREAAEEPDAQQKAQGISMSLSERAAQAASGGAEADAWQTLIKTFLTRADVYAAGVNVEDNVVCLIRKVLPESCRSIPFFSTRCKAGLGMLFPCPAAAEAKGARPFVPTLELHRAVLALERDAEAMLRALAAEVVRREPLEKWEAFMAGSDPTFVADLQAALLAKGGVGGAGPAYWSAELEPAFPSLGPNVPSAGPLATCVEQLRAARPAAFRHRYVVADQNTWGLAVLAAVVGVKNEFAQMAALRGSARQEQPHNFQYRLDAQNKFRRQALEVDQAPLIRYGALMARYTARLAHFAAVFGTDRVHESRLGTVFLGLAVSPLHGVNDVVLDVLTRERMEVEALTRQLYLTDRHALAVARVRQVNDAILEALRTDSHQAQATMWLFPSPHLPYAKYNPARYAPLK